MSLEILTKNDLKSFKEELIADFKTIMSNSSAKHKQWLKSSEVRKLLKISAGTLQNFRINGTLPYTKIGGVIFYAYEDILEMIEKNKYNNAQ